MTSSRISRIEQLARLAFDERRWGRITVDCDHGGVDVLCEAGGLLLGIQAHPHAEEAIEMALIAIVARMRLEEERLTEVAARRLHAPGGAEEGESQ